MDDVESTLTRVVRRAGRIVAEADLPEPLRRHAFERTLDVLISEAGLGGAAPAVRPASAGPSHEPSPPSDDVRADPLVEVARRAGVDPEAARDVYRTDGDGVALVVGDKKLDRNKATGSREITLLVAGGRQAAGLEEWTSLTRTREACSLYNRLDSKNYAATVKSMGDVFNIHGQGVHREVRLTMPGWDEWAALVRHLITLGATGGR